MIRPTMLAAFVNGPAWVLDQALTRLAPSTPAHVIEAENTRLRDRVKSLEAQRDYLIADAEEAARAEAMRRHPASGELDLEATLHTAKVAASAEVRAEMFGCDDLAEWDREFVFDQEAGE